MIIDFVAMQIEKFQRLAEEIQSEPECYLDFDSVSDFYKAKWLQDFPQGTTWAVTGLDNGADEFNILIEYRHYFLEIEYCQQLKVYTGIKQLRV